MSFKVLKVSEVKFNRNEFISLCQDVMTGIVVIDQQAFFQKLTKNLFPGTDPITKNILIENVNGLYAFLIVMSSHPMCVPLSHAMTNTFLDTIHVDNVDISKVLTKHNTEYSLNPDAKLIYKKARQHGCPYDVYFNHILGNNRWTKGVGRVKVILIYKESDSSAPNAVEFKLNVPFRSVRKTMYVDITGLRRPKGETTLAFVHVDNKFEFQEFSNDYIFGKNTSIGKALSEYYVMWREKEKLLSDAYSKFTKHVKWMYFTGI